MAITIDRFLEVREELIKLEDLDLSKDQKDKLIKELNIEEHELRFFLTMIACERIKERGIL